MLGPYREGREKILETRGYGLGGALGCGKQEWAVKLLL